MRVTAHTEKAGVPYDALQTILDGKGKWWEGLDPQELYCQNHKPGEKPDEAYARQFYLRTKAEKSGHLIDFSGKPRFMDQLDRPVVEGMSESQIEALHE